MSVVRIIFGLIGLVAFAAIGMNVPMTPPIYLLAMIVLGAPSMAMIIGGVSGLVRKKDEPAPSD